MNLVPFLFNSSPSNLHETSRFSCIFFFLFSCSKLETGLSLAPRYLENQIDNAFDFKSEKNTRIRKQLEVDIKSLKKELAKKMLVHLEQIENTFLNAEPTVESISKIFDDIAQTQTVLFQSFNASAAVTLKDLSADEIKHFKKYSDKKYDEEKDLSKNKKAFLKKRKASFFKTFEFFLDDLTSEQEKLLTDFVEKNLDYFSNRIGARQKFSDSFYFKMQGHEPILEYFLNHYSGKKLSAFSDSDQKDYLLRFFNFQIGFWKTVSQDQKNYFRKILNNYKEELKKMAAG